MISPKQDTPTMGGIFILIAVVISTLLWADMTNRFILLSLFCTIWLGITGFLDDYIKLTQKKSKGLTATAKFTSQILLGLILGTILYVYANSNTAIDVPFLKNAALNLGIFYILFVVLVITGTSNAVNLTDG
ncbi:MAG: phospho-N-acetylmuramoyl-pentapeptide-transferase, partial [Candidatus Omnitrophica bacterium]|nr:phospho-N-acetylmuramoyl-pentapeptide-transferase [Candidatus Omnitrophota bacterium]